MRSTIEVYDPKTRRFSVIGHIGTPRARHTATLLADGRVLLAGGLAGPEQSSECPDVPVAVADAELVDPASGTSVPTGPLITERSGQSATLFDDGRCSSPEARIASGARCPRSSTSRRPARSPRQPPPATSISSGSRPMLPDGRVLLAGSEATTELFDPTRTVPGSTRPEPSTPDAAGPHRAVDTADQRSGHVAIRLRDGRVLVAGGVGGANNDRLASAEVFDPTTGTFEPVGAMAGPRQGDASMSASSPRSFPTAGSWSIGGSPGVESAEIYDPASGAIAPAPEFAIGPCVRRPEPGRRARRRRDPARDTPRRFEGSRPVSMRSLHCPGPPARCALADRRRGHPGRRRDAGRSRPVLVWIQPTGDLRSARRFHRPNGDRGWLEPCGSDARRPSACSPPATRTVSAKRWPSARQRSSIPSPAASRSSRRTPRVARWPRFPTDDSCSWVAPPTTRMRRPPCSTRRPAQRVMLARS